MKKTLLFSLLIVLVAGFATAQTDFDAYEQSIKDFATGVSSSLPLNAAVGLNWSDSYIGGLPHFGVGAVVGFSTIPYSAVKPVLTALSLDTTVEANEGFQYISEFGAPLPAYAVEARVGGLILPFDVGVKFGTVPQGTDLQAVAPNFNFDYLLAGIDVRLQLIEENFILPGISVGAGYNRLNASIGLTGVAGGDITLGSFDDPRTPAPDNITFTLSDPELEYFWQANVIDIKAHASKNLLFFTPYAGFGASIGFGQAGGALRSSVTNDGGLTQTDIDAINEELAKQTDGTIPQIGDQGIEVTSDMTDGWAFRAYGGVSFNLLILKVDVTGMYDFIGQNYGLTLGTRIQL
jgi:hypothetical protein